MADNSLCLLEPNLNSENHVSYMEQTRKMSTDVSMLVVASAFTVVVIWQTVIREVLW